MNHVNLTAYDDVEDSANFSDTSRLAYYEKKLAASTTISDFLKHHCAEAHWPARVCELGAGNSNLLYRLEMDEMLSEGIGIEISPSRHAFAEAFKNHLGSTAVTNILGNFLDQKPLQQQDLILGVDIVFQMIPPLYPTAESDALTWIRESLSPGGYLALELRTFNDFKRQLQLEDDKILRTWESFPEPDPFEYVLAEISMTNEQYIYWDKLFLKRNSTDRSRFTNILKPYEPEHMTTLLSQHGFSHTQVFQNWTGRELDLTYMVLTRKPEEQEK
jgi:hypothetical protein